SSCMEYDAFWSREFNPSGQTIIIDFRSRLVGDRVCVKCVGMDQVEATLDLSQMSSLINLEKIVVKKDGKTIAEKTFENSFCGGIAAFPCPTGYQCVLDGNFPDAGGKCMQSTQGYLRGKATVGPICPVERPDEPCDVPPEAYTSRKLTATGPNGQEKMMLIDIDGSGYYSAGMEPGKYIIDLQRNGMDRSADLPREVEIKAGETVTLNVDIDTGIR
ncbi:MAG: hypothetical protein V1658_00700, partial [Candidatus Micrarchaeota archaeon]